MERLLRSSYPIPFRIQVKPSPFSPQLGRVHSLKPNLPSPTCSELTRVDSISSKHENPSPFSSASSEHVFNLQILSSSGADSAKGSEPQSHSRDSGKKATALGRATLLFALVTIAAINPILAPRAFAEEAGKGLMRVEILSSAWMGFLAGCLHTLSGPDHLAALAPLSIGRTRMESAAVGALWGCGHDTGQLIFGMIFLLLKHRLHIEVIRTWGTRVVGLTLLVIGAMGIREASECDLAPINPTRAEKPKQKKKIGFATFATGIVHGLQPDALMMVLPALALPSRVAGAAYLGMFLLGTVIAMGCYTVFIGSCSEALKDRVPRITEKLTWVSSLIAIGLGLAIIISQYFGYSLY